MSESRRERESRIRRGIDNLTRQSAGSPLFEGLSDADRRERIRSAVTKSEARNPHATDPA